MSNTEKTFNLAKIYVILTKLCKGLEIFKIIQKITYQKKFQ